MLTRIWSSSEGGLASIPASVSASFDKEHSYINQTRTAADVSSLVVTYNVSIRVFQIPVVLEVSDNLTLTNLRTC